MVRIIRSPGRLNRRFLVILEVAIALIIALHDKESILELGNWVRLLRVNNLFFWHEKTYFFWDFKNIFGRLSG